MEEGSGGSNKLPVLKKLTRCQGRDNSLSSHSAPTMTGGTLEDRGPCRNPAQIKTGNGKEISGMRNNLLEERKMHMMGGDRQKPEKTSVRPLNAMLRRWTIFCGQSRPARIQTAMSGSRFTRKTGGVIQVMNI